MKTNRNPIKRKKPAGCTKLFSIRISYYGMTHKSENCVEVSHLLSAPLVFQSYAPYAGTVGKDGPIVQDRNILRTPVSVWVGGVSDILDNGWVVEGELRTMLG